MCTGAVDEVKASKATEGPGFQCPIASERSNEQCLIFLKFYNKL